MNELERQLAREHTLAETWKHIHRVGYHLRTMVHALLDRMERHDASKLADPELDGFSAHTAKLKDLKYGSPEYHEVLKELQGVIEHHYDRNSHHPQYYPLGIDGMDLIDIVEMFCDWAAAGERHTSGNFAKSLAINKERFKMSDQLVAIFRNTAERLELIIDTDYDDDDR